MKKKASNTPHKKSGKSVNWFEAQAMKNQASPQAKSESSKQTAKPKQADYKPVTEAPIIKVQAKSKKEAEHYEAAYAFAQRMSDPNSSEQMTVHLNMRDELEFNIKQDDRFQALWESGELMLLVAFPRNWKTAPLQISEEEADEFDDLDTEEGKFDYLYETGMAVFEG